MEFFLLIVLAVAVFVLWLKTQDANSSLRDHIARLEREIDFLRSQIGALVKAQSASAAPRPAEPATTEPKPPPQAVSAPPPVVVQHAPPPPPVSPRPVQPSPAATAAPAPPVAPPRPPFPSQPPAAPKPSARERGFSLEQTLGANWLGKIGFACVVIGITFFLAVKFQTWGPPEKSSVALL